MLLPFSVTLGVLQLAAWRPVARRITPRIATASS
jgi:hypothetical protein